MKATVLHSDVFHCFTPGLTDHSGDPVNAEISAVAFNVKALVMSSDKPIPGEHRSAVFAVDYAHGQLHPESLVYYTNPLIREGRKYEDFALTPNGSHMAVTTGFDRFDSDNRNGHRYNQLLIWPTGHPDDASIIDDAQFETGNSSIGIRESLTDLLGLPYFKIEGLAAIPDPDSDADGILLFGIREMGQDYDNFEYKVCIVGAPFRLRSGALQFTDDCCVCYDFHPATVVNLEHTIGVSSLEYDGFNNRLYILTSFESEADDGTPANGSYLWVIGLDDFHDRNTPEPVLDDQGQLLTFENKAEGLAVVSPRRLFVVYGPDQDTAVGAHQAREQRQPHEAPYTLLKLIDE